MKQQAKKEIEQEEDFDDTLENPLALIYAK
jgi:hypothetical protein